MLRAQQQVLFENHWGFFQIQSFLRWELVKMQLVRNYAATHHHLNMTRTPIHNYYSFFNDLLDPTLALQLHGILMIIAWWFVFPLAIITARYFKLELSQKVLWKVLWFQSHRALAIFGVILVTIGFGCILVHRNWTWVSVRNQERFTHSLFGMLVIIMMVIQAMVAFMRPRVDHPKRPYFTWFHRMLGVSTWLLSQLVILLATWFKSGGLMPDQRLGELPRGTMIVYWFLALVLFSALELCQTSAKVADSLSANEETMHYALYTEEQLNYMAARTKVVSAKATLWVMITVSFALLSGAMGYYITLATAD